MPLAEALNNKKLPCVQLSGIFQHYRKATE